MRRGRRPPLAVVSLVALLPRPTSGLPASVQGRRILYQNGTALHIKGVNWNPIPRGAGHPWGLAFAGAAFEDGLLMAQAGANVLRTYEPLVDRTVLDILHFHGIQVINTIYATARDPLGNIIYRVNAVKDHPAMLMWALGNEWNYNLCYQSQGISHDQCAGLLETAARIVKQYDPTHPVATVYGGVPEAQVVASMPSVDVWGINYYDGLTFSDLFARWEAVSTKPFFLGEYGADAFNAEARSADPAAQAHATRALTQEIADNSVLRGGVCSGGLIFELADEWWKDGGGSMDRQDEGGVAPGSGLYPDRTFNEEWWGLTTIDRVPREAYFAFAGVAMPRAPSCGGAALADAKRLCSADGCRVLATAMQGRTCAQYCAGHNLACTGAWEEVGDTCSPQQQLRCDQVFETSDLLCQCAGGGSSQQGGASNVSAASLAAAAAAPAAAKTTFNSTARLQCTRGGCSTVPTAGGAFGLT